MTLQPKPQGKGWEIWPHSSDRSALTLVQLSYSITKAQKPPSYSQELKHIDWDIEVKKIIIVTRCKSLIWSSIPCYRFLMNRQLSVSPLWTMEQKMLDVRGRGVARSSLWELCSSRLHLFLQTVPFACDWLNTSQVTDNAPLTHPFMSQESIYTF